MVYSIEVQGKTVTNLSYAGVKEYVRSRGHFKIIEVRTEQDDKGYRCLIILKDLDRDIEVTGASACEKSKPFAWTLAVNKAERNAYRKLIPERTIANLIEEWLERKKPRSVTAQPVPAKEAESVGTSQGTTIPPESPVPLAESPMVEPSQPEPRSLASISNELLASELAKLPWRENSKGEGWNVSWDSLPQLIKAKLATMILELKGTQYVKLSGYSYKRFGVESEMLARYTTKPNLQVPAASPEAPIEKIIVEPWTLKRVPVTKDFDPKLPSQGIRQTPLFAKEDERKSVGMINYADDGSEISLVPEHPISLESPPLRTFLLGKGLPGMKLKHEKEGFDYCVQNDEGGQLLTAILIRGNLSSDQIKELTTMARWTFDRALEEKKA